ncbi:MAG: lysophospholipid acyltransferase family protein [Acidobacteriaceae bacterium]|nr:lysophospholipid acyltransferase family protein [Acidobacteriaceae bacterium]
MMRWLFPDRLLQIVPDWKNTPPRATEFARHLLSDLNIRYDVSAGDLALIPPRGNALIVANHPFGFLEGLLLLAFLEDIRVDYRIVANHLLSSVPALQERLIFVNPFAERASATNNARGIRAAIEWLLSGGLLVMFPAGQVAHLNWGERPVADPKWSTAAVRIASKVQCATLPIFFDGANSAGFQMAGMLHPKLRTLNLANELVNKSGRTISIRLGNPIPASVLNRYATPETATDYLRARIYLLGERSEARVARTAQRSAWLEKPNAIIQPVLRSLLAEEIKALPPERILVRSDEFAVCFAAAHEIPNAMREIGRCRELTYRDVGEGTGRALDLDRFDEHYSHLILWHSAESRVAGAYRLAATPDILPAHGIKGLYTSTLFSYRQAFFTHIGPAFELGRSFICRDYQKHYSPLLLLWKGILKYVAQRPECAVLFGAVSMSSEYHPLSRTLMVNFLNGQISNRASDWIRPRRAFRPRPLLPKHVKQLRRLLPSLEELSSSIQDLEADGKGLPILIKQYLKIGGQLLSFNVDPGFSDALDVLVMADLRTASRPMLERCMGRQEAENFRAWHAARNSLRA